MGLSSFSILMSFAIFMQSFILLRLDAQFFYLFTGLLPQFCWQEWVKTLKSIFFGFWFDFLIARIFNKGSLSRSLYWKPWRLWNENFPTKLLLKKCKYLKDLRKEVSNKWMAEEYGVPRNAIQLGWERRNFVRLWRYSWKYSSYIRFLFCLFVCLFVCLV